MPYSENQDNTDLYSGDNKKLISTISENTLKLRSKEWVENVLNNLPDFINSIDLYELVGMSNGRPAVCCAAGPSLAKQLPLLKRIQKYVTVIAVNTSYEPLIKAGIEPDITMCIESKDVSSMFTGLPLRGIFAHSCESGTALNDTRFPYHLLWCNSTGVYSDWMRYRMAEGVSIDGGGSVACGAFSMAITLKPSKVILIGQDLAYTGGQAYSKGSRYQTKRTEQKKSVIFDQNVGMIFTARKRGINEKADDYNAGRMGCVMKWHPHTLKKPPVCPICKGKDENCRSCNGSFYACEYTSESFAFFLNWFLSAAEVTKKIAPGLEIVNATEGGAFIAGFKHERFKSAVRGVTKKLAPKNFKRHFSSLKTREPRRDNYIKELADILVASKSQSLDWMLKEIPLFKIYTNAIHMRVHGGAVIDFDSLSDEQVEKLETARGDFCELVGGVLKRLSNPVLGNG